jgi:hypothetical protein
MRITSGIVGVRATKGVLLASKNRPIAFHRSLTKSDCTACYSNHSRTGTGETIVAECCK